MLQVGIYKNLVISATSLVASKKDANVKNHIITFKQASSGSKLSRLSNATIDSSNEDSSNDFLLFGFKPEKWNGEAMTSDEVYEMIQERRDLLTYILSQYMTVDKIAWDLEKGTGLTDANADTKILDKDVLDKIYLNLSEQFIKMMKPFVGDNGKRFACVFPRSSAKSHFPKLRSRFLDSQGFMAPMDEPALVAKIGFTKYELEKGLNNPDKVEADSDGSSTESAEQKAQVDMLFGEETEADTDTTTESNDLF
jgi:hypothetical protein